MVIKIKSWLKNVLLYKYIFQSISIFSLIILGSLIILPIFFYEIIKLIKKIKFK